MRNITVNIPDETYRRARIWAAQRDTSVSAVVNYLLETLPSQKRAFHTVPASTVNPAQAVDKSTSN
jgi:plasmid stability protein